MSYHTDFTLTVPTADGRSVRVRCEVAATASTRATGLMGRASLAPGTGMLLAWPYEMPRSIWMANAPLALDLIFLDKNFAIVGIGHGTPLSRASIKHKSAQYVLEVPAGWCERHGVDVGTHTTPSSALVATA